ncbi:MAG: AsmA family protein, partial [Candidatus Promineifilaceae bacterium]
MRWKWIVTIGVLVIVCLVATVYVVLNTYDYNKLKPLVARMVEEATGRKLSLEGKVNLEIGLMPTLVVTNIALANVSWGSQPQMIEIEKLQAQVRLLPLLHKDVEVNQIGLFGVKVLLETDANGQDNWDFPAERSAAGSPGARKPVEIDVERLTIENLHLTFNRQKTGSQTQFTLESLAMNRQETEDALALNLQADVDGQAVTLSGKTGGVRQLLAHKRFPLQLSGSLANAAIEMNGAIDDVLNLQGIELEARLSGKNMATLAPFIDIRLPKTKAFEVNGALKGSKESLKLENVKGNLSGSSFDLAISGSISDVIAISGVDLKLISSGKDLAEIGQIIGEKLPVTDDFTVQGRLTGSA